MSRKTKLAAKRTTKRRRKTKLTPRQVAARREFWMIVEELTVTALDVWDGDTPEHALGKLRHRLERRASDRKAMEAGASRAEVAFGNMAMTERAK